MQRNIPYRVWATVLFFVALLGSCKKQNLPVKPEPSAFSAALKNNTVFTAAGGKDTIVVKGGTNGWWVTMPDNDWVVITKRYGSAEFNLPVTVKPNTTGIAREITVIINPTFNLPPVAIKLTQSN